MAVKATSQVTLIDVTDAYSVMLTSESYTFVGGTGGVGSGQTCTTEAVAFCGSNQCPSVAVTAADISCPTGISATVENSGTSKVKITFKTIATISAACEATIPVVVDGITMNKKFSFAVAKTGPTGAAGKDAIILSYTASNGIVFKNNAGSTVLTAHVFVGGVEKAISDAGVVADNLGSIKWYLTGSATAIATSKTLTVAADDVLNTASYTCQLEG